MEGKTTKADRWIDFLVPNGNQRIAVTIDGEDLMEFVQAVYEDAQQKAAIALSGQGYVPVDPFDEIVVPRVVSTCRYGFGPDPKTAFGT